MSMVLVPATSRVTHFFLFFLKVDLSSTSELVATGSKQHSDDDEDSNREVNAVQNGGGVDSKKVKVKKPKKPKVNVVEAASKIDLDDLGAFLVNITVSDWLIQILWLFQLICWFSFVFCEFLI